jgi:DNA-binding beta-propeller fold protein YncE
MRFGRLVACAVLVAAFGCRSSPSPLRLIPIPGRPSAVTVNGKDVWVADDLLRALHRIDAATGQRRGHHVELDRNPVALAAGGGGIWVAHASGTLIRVDAKMQSPSFPTKVGGSLTGIVYRAGRVYVTDHKTSSVVEVDARTTRVLRTFKLADGAVRIASAGRYLWVTNDENTVTRVDPRSGRVGPVVRVGNGPIGLAAGDGRVWVANSDDGTVSRIDATSGRRIGSPVKVGGAPVAVTVTGGSVWVAGQETKSLTRIDPSSGRVVGEAYELGIEPRGIAGGAGAVWTVGTNPSAMIRVQL